MISNSSKTSNSTKKETYILNKNTKKFHKSTCSGVKDMKDKNKEEYTGNRADLIKEGYEPCSSASRKNYETSDLFAIEIIIENVISTYNR